MDRLTELLARADRPPSAWEAVDALVPGRADLAIIFLHDRGALRVKAFAHIDPLQHPVLRTFQQTYAPSPDDPASAAARVFRTGEPLLIRPADAALLELEVESPVLRATFKALGPRNTMIVPLCEGGGAAPIGVLVASMMVSGRQLDEDDMASLALIARDLAERFTR